MPVSKHRFFKFAIRSLLGLVGITIIFSGLLLWRLSSSPLQLNKLKPSIQDAVSSLPGGYQVEFEGIELFLNRQDKKIQLRATNVALADHGGARSTV